MHTQTDKQIYELHFKVSEKVLMSNIILIFLILGFAVVHRIVEFQKRFNCITDYIT